MDIIRAEEIHLGDASFLFDKYRLFYKQKSDVDAALNFLEARVRNSESVIFLAYVDKKPVGFMQLYPMFSSISMQRAWLLNDLFVDEGSRKCGVASALLDAASEFGKKSGAKYLMLQTGIENLVAQRLYEGKNWRRDSDLFYRFDFVDLENLNTAKLPPRIRK